jgi:bifunctional non-homologous end joining protein LigD
VTNQNTITQHIWGSRVPRLMFPDLCVFDLDPPANDDARVREAALGLRDLLTEVGLPSWVKTSGSKGFHIVVPVDGETKMGTVARVAHGIAAIYTARAPDRLTQEFSKSDRAGRIYVDSGRNGYSATFAAAYTVRARPGAPVSAPCTWDEVAAGEVGPQTFTLRTMPARLAKVGDLWADLHENGQPLAAVADRIRALVPGSDSV